jgi:type II restriction enzyme
MINNQQKTGNVGEWSELYALAFLLVNGGAYGADKNQRRNNELFYRVLKIIYAEKIGEEKLTYEIDKEIINIFAGLQKIASINVTKIQPILRKMFEGLVIKNEGRAFPLEAGSEMMRILQKDFISAPSSEKKDLDLIILDNKTKQPSPELGFSIKSQLGGASTLINASGATNFIFEILDKNMQIPKEAPELVNDSIRDSVKLLLKAEYNIVFNKVDNDIFNNNLCLIDSNLPQHIAKILLSYYSGDATRVIDLVDKNFPVSNKQNEQPVHKIKEFMTNMASGMMPSKVWDGIITSLGGLILVKKDGDVLFYYLYNLKDFQDYLISNTKLETGSRKRHKFGKIIKCENRYFIKLNLQVRFIK